MRRSIAAIAALWFLAGIVFSAEKERAQRELTPFRYLVDKSSAEDKQCGPYFALTARGSNGEKKLIYFIRGESRARLFPQRMVVAKLNKKKKVPTIRYALLQNGGASVATVGLAVEISPSDFNLTQGCLPQAVP